MPICPNSSLFQKNNARNISYMTVIVFEKCLDFGQKAYSRTSSYLSSSCLHTIYNCLLENRAFGPLYT